MYKTTHPTYWIKDIKYIDITTRDKLWVHPYYLEWDNALIYLDITIDKKYYLITKLLIYVLPN